jgi:hypothetical protein
MVAAVIITVSFRQRREASKRFCATFGIPFDWPDPVVLERYVVRAQTLRVAALVAGVAAGGVAAKLIPTRGPALAVYCLAPQTNGPPLELTSSAIRNVDSLRRARANPSFVRAPAVNGGVFTFTCAPPALLGPQISTTPSDRKRERPALAAALGGLLAYTLATWRTERRALRFAPASVPAEEANCASEDNDIGKVRRSINPLIRFGLLGVLLIFPLRSTPGSTIRIVAGIVAVVLFGASAAGIVRLVRSHTPVLEPQSRRAASLQRRQLRDYLPPWMVWIAAAYTAWIAALLILSITTSDLSDPLLWPSWRYEPTAYIGLIVILTALSVIAAMRIVMAPQPFAIDDTKAAIIDDARRVGAVQRLAAATMTAGVIASSPIARLLITADGHFLGTLTIVILAAFWIAVPGTTDTLHHRWVAIVSQPADLAT